MQSELLPIRELLQQMHASVGEVRESRAADAAALTKMVQRVTEEQTAHRRGTAKLSQLLRSSTVRGQYGELTLQRTLEHAGLIEHKHYVAQVSPRDEAGLYRPDALALLPGNRCLVIDSKTPLQHLLDAQQAAWRRATWPRPAVRARDEPLATSRFMIRFMITKGALCAYSAILAASGSWSVERDPRMGRDDKSR